MSRASSIKFKLMPDGHIRGYRCDRLDAPSASEAVFYPPILASPTITAAHMPKLYLTDHAIYEALHNSQTQKRGR